jgi:nickel-dependent lactate racemase
MVAKEVEKRLKEVQEIAWNVGTRMIVQVVPGSGEEILEVVSGDADSVQKHVDELCHQIWHFKAEQKASLVVATMTGGRQQQTWTALARVIQSALKLVQHDGAIAICSDLKMRPGAAVSKLMGSDSPEQADYLISKEGTPDAIAATMIARALEQTRVYLLSNYDEEFVEDLGIAFVSSADEVVRLASRQESCITLSNAQNAFIELSEESLTC